MLYNVLNFAILIFWFIPLILGSNFLVDGASAIAKHFKVSNLIIGLTVVAFGTSSPELIVNILASLSGKSEIPLGNILGSNIFNILLILGISSIVFPLAVKRTLTEQEIPLCILSAIVIFLLANDTMIDKNPINIISRIDGIVLVLFFAIFMFSNIQSMKREDEIEEIPIRRYSLKKAFLLTAAGFVLLFLGGRFIVIYAVKIALSIGISDRIIALTIISIGTSLPELSTSVTAAFKKNTDLAIGNIVGSNIFNVFFILGISSIIHPVNVNIHSNLDLLINLGASLVLFVFIFTGSGRKISRPEGFILSISYLIYVGVLILRI